MLLHALLDAFERLQRFLAVTRQHVERELRIEHIGFQFLERQHAYGLLLQFVKSALAALAGGLEYVNHGPANAWPPWRVVPRNIARAMAAGCAITCMASRNAAGVASAKGARRRASGCSSSPPARSIRRGPPLGFTLSARRLEAGEPARNATVAPAKLSAVSGAMTIGSSSSAASLACPSADAEISCTRGAGLLSLQHFANFFRQQRVAAHQRDQGTFGQASQLDAPDVVPALGLRVGACDAADDTAGANDDAAQDVTDRHAQQHRCRRTPDQVR